jgi:hypothetical protein
MEICWTKMLMVVAKEQASEERSGATALNHTRPGVLEVAVELNLYRKYFMSFHIAVICRVIHSFHALKP